MVDNRVYNRGMFEIGASLREARLRQGLDFPAIEAGTKIRGKYLRALEDEQFAHLPAQTYVKGFLRTYAEYLGLDGELYVDEFNSRYVVGEDEPPIRARRTARPHVRKRVAGNVLLAALVGIALLTALVIAAFKSPPSHQNVVGVSPPAKTHKPAVSTKASVTFRAVRPLTLTVHLNGPTGKVVAADTALAAGEVLHFTAKRLWVTTGSPANLRVSINAKRVALRGAPQVFVVTSRGISAA
jgi:hypothetical protein